VTRLGFAGVGWLGESLIKDLPVAPGLRLAAVQDLREDLARDIAERYGAAWYGTSFDDLLARADVDAVVICTPNALHVPQSEAAMRAGKDVLVQKPLALTEAEARGVLERARGLDRLLFVDYSYRFLDTVRVLREQLALAGRVQRVRAAFHNIYGPGAEKTWFFKPELSGGGALTDLGVHLLDLGLWLLEPASVVLRTTRLDAPDIEHSAQLELDLEDVPFELDVSWNAPRAETEISFELVCEQGHLRWENVAGSFFRFRTRRADDVLIERETTLREDTLRAFARALQTRAAPVIDPRVYALLDQAYGRSASSTRVA
jgi:predicted dehydrogenase